MSTRTTGYRVVRVPWSVLSVGLAAAAVLGVVLVRGHRAPWGAGPLVLLLGLVLEVRRRALVLRVDDDGVLMCPRRADQWGPALQVPWSSVARLVVGPGDLVGVGLLPRAPLPVGVRGVTHDPSRPSAVQPGLTRRVPGVDVQRLREAVGQLTAGRVPVERDPDARPYS